MARFKASEVDNYGGSGGAGFFSLKNDKDVANVRFLYDNIEDVEGELPHVVGSSFNYHQYSQDDNSNERFLEKQKKQNSLRGTLFEQIADGRQEQSYMQKPKDEQTLFDTDIIWNIKRKLTF